MSGKKTAKFDADGIANLAKNNPVVYELLNDKRENIYTGSAKRGRVEERLTEHLPGGPDPIPGAVRVKIIQKASIDDARKAEARIIKRSQPKHNKRGK